MSAPRTDCPADVAQRVGYPGSNRWLMLYQDAGLAVLDDGQIRMAVPPPAARHLAIPDHRCLLVDLAELQTFTVARSQAKKMIAAQTPRGPIDLDALHQLERRLVDLAS